jgi:hypothetical protein
MPTVYLVNVGANVAHKSEARSPLFDDGTFRFVTFPDKDCRMEYPAEARRFVRDPVRMRTHLDPDWSNLTYGDCCGNPRAGALLRVKQDDILLFWGLFWRVGAPAASVWDSTEKTWCLLGALRVEGVLEAGESVAHLPPVERRRALENAHMRGNRVERRESVRVFLGNLKYSARFRRAVDLGVYRDDSLLKRIVRARDGRPIRWHEPPRWNSVTRSCRPILDLSLKADLSTAAFLRDGIGSLNPGFDLLAGIH